MEFATTQLQTICLEPSTGRNKSTPFRKDMSTRSKMAFLLCLLAVLPSAVLALPAIHPRSHTNAVPLDGLPCPTNLTLKHVALGVGTQNYTCASAGSAPVAVGAVAALYDATFLSLPQNRLAIPSFAALAYGTKSSLGLPALGHHWFSAAAVPTFDLDAADPPALLSAAKVAQVSAPEGSVPGSVAWLFLQDDGRGVSKGLEAVYRVETAGGAAPESCEGEGSLEVGYAAEYWFYD